MKNEHELKETLQVDIWYPDHPPRSESSLFCETKRALIEHKDIPCYVCGTKTSREVHHFHVEWAFADAVDWDRMKTLHPDFDWTKFTAPVDFVDSEYNMMVLCASHHRLKDHGIHNLPYPVWIMQKHAKTGFDLFTAPLAAIDPTTIPPDPLQ